MSRFCDVSLPVPLDRAFTYELPETLRHRVKPGCRILAPFGSRKLTGTVVRTHDDPPPVTAKLALRLLDEEPVLNDEMLGLGRWIASYYCAPLGEVYRTMAPLTGEVRHQKTYLLTDQGRDFARQLFLGDGDKSTAAQILHILETRPMSASHLTKKFEDAPKVLKSLEKKGLIALEENLLERDPARASAEHLAIEFTTRPAGVKFNKAERELIAFLELHPGPHSLAKAEEAVKGAGPAARALGRRGVIKLNIRSPFANHASTERPPHALNPWQQAAFDAIGAQIAKGEFHAFLLQGVTGSGKTEVYLNAIDSALALDRGALLLVPEIALTPAVAGQFFGRFGDRVSILHSAFSEVERADQWKRIRRGESRVIVGTRSGIFAPVRNLGLIIVDEEHDGSYKQEETPRYNGRDLAVVRAQGLNAVVVLGSATPSLETKYNAERGKYTLLSLPERIAQRPMPQVELIDMRMEFLETRKHNVFSRRLLDCLKERLESGEQAMLLLNRRGFSSFVACRACGEKVQCINCAVTLTFHRRDRRLLCHYCNHAEKVPAVCPKCNSEYMQFLGTGAEKVEDELHQQFPTARIARLDRDTVTSKRHYETILSGFREGAFDILVGTQMIAKGHDIPNVTLVGIVSADVGLGMPDFRAAERTFQLLTQAAGRAGRGNLPGQVMIQTINPDHYAVRFASQQDYELFYEKEVQFRKLMRYPPFSALANILVRAEKQEDALRMSAELGQFLTPPPESLKVLGPAEAPVPRLKNEFRYQMLIKAASRKLLNETLQRVRKFAADQQWPAARLMIDVDPLSLM